MKHLKTYEKFGWFKKEKESTKYKIGDFVKIQWPKDMRYKITRDFNKDYLTRGKIIELPFDVRANHYKIIWSDSNNTWCPEEYIIGKLTPEEIEQFELESSIQKYNL